jgi:WD40 repeat protein/serine/threonine protein kinase
MATRQLDEESIFNAARRIENADARSTFIMQACGDDPAVIERVMALLEAYERDPEFMQNPNPSPVTADYAPISERPGARVGPYRLMEQIGEGGFGLVFVAEQQEPMRRKVALKVIKPGMDSKQVIARFEAERQALAMMDHPNIARVLDAGATESGRPYFVMELVRGIPITDYCDQNHLTPRERLELFVSVCNAIQHAHQKGIIHRDVKPSNVLVTLHDGKPVPKVIDFGVAKAIHQPLTERTIYTNFAQMIGTPLYMSPEQAEMSGLDIDTRSDIYSLGVLLYELLTGSTPLGKKQIATAAYDEIRRMIRSEDLPRPSQRLSTSETLASIAALRKTEPARLSKMLRGEVDWIVMKALEKDRTRRYDTASALARDVERYLADEPVEACPPSAMYALKKFARNHRKALTTAAVLAALLLLGALVTGWQAMRARQAEAAALAERDAKELALKSAIDNELKANSAADSEKSAKNSETMQRKLAEGERDAKRAALNEAEGLRLTAQSSVVLPSNPGLALLLAIEGAHHGIRRAPHNNALLAAINANRELRTLRLPAVAFNSARYSRDGRYLLTISGPKESTRLNAYDAMAAQVWEAATGKLLLNVHVPGLFFGSMDLSSDGRRLVVSFLGAAIARYADGRQFIFTDHSARIWDVASGEELTVLKGHTDRVVSVQFSPDGNQVLTASWDGSARLWDAATGKEQRKLSADKYSLTWANFSADGRRLLTFCDVAQSESSAEVKDFQQREGWDRNAERDPPLDAKASASKILSLFSSKSGGSSWNTDQDTRRRARLWDAATAEPIAVLMREEDRKVAEHETTCAAFSPDGRFALTGDIDGTTLVWDAATGKISKRWDRQDTTPPNPDGSQRFFTLISVALSVDGRRLIRVHADNSVSVLDVSNGREIAHFTGFTSGVRSAEASPDGRRVLVLPGDEGRMNRGKWYPGSDGQLVLNVRDDRTVYLCDVATGGNSAVFRGHEDDVASAAFHPNGRQVVTASRDGTVRIWDAEDRDGYATVLRGHKSALAEAAFSSDGRYLLTAFGVKPQVTGSIGGDREVRIWDASGRPVSVLKGLAELGDSPVREKLLGPVQSARFSPDGRRVLVLSKDYAARMSSPEEKPDPRWTYTPARILDTQTGKELVALQGMTNGLRSAALSPDGRFILTVSDRNEYIRILTPKGEERGYTAGGGQPDYTVRIWDAKTGAVVHTLLGKNDMCDCAAWCPDSKRVITAGWRSAPLNRYAIQIWDVEPGKEILSLDEKAGPIEEVAFSPDGKRIVGFRRNYTNDHELVPLWDAETGKVVSVLRGHRGDITAVAFSPDSRFLATASQDRTIRLWDAMTAKAELALAGHERPVNSASFSRDGRWLVSGSDDGTARIWDIATGKEYFTLSGHEGPVYAAVFSPDSSLVLTTSGDGTARIWPVDPLPLAQARKPRALTADERRRFEIHDE